MSALAHWIERAGIATVLIGLIPQHVAAMQPPRALLVPFELGRPFGAPGQPDFQQRVLQQALELAGRDDVPVVETFPDDAPGADQGEEPWACPVSFAPPEAEQTGSQAIREEISRLRPWHDRTREVRGSTSVGASEMELDAAADFLVGCLDSVPDHSPVAGSTPGRTLKLAAEDLKQFYLEAATARPGAGSRELADWFWNDTHAGALLRDLARTLADSDDREIAIHARATLVPETHRRPPTTTGEAPA